VERRALTKRLVDKLSTDDPHGRHVYDTEVRRFGVTVYASGKKSFWVRYPDPHGRLAQPRSARAAEAARSPGKRWRRFHLGKYGEITVDEARGDALSALAEVRKGHDPAEEKAHRRSAPSVPTFQEWVTEYLEGVRQRKRQPRHDEAYLSAACKRWGNRAIDSITTEDISRLVQSTAEEHPASANRLLASIGACMQAAWRLDKVASNPARRVQRLRENAPRQRVLTDEEFHRVLRELAAWPDPWERAAFLLLIQTGARLSEVLHARWEDVDLEAGEWRIPNPKAGHPQLVPLNPPTVAVLRRLRRLGALVVPGKTNPNTPRYDLKPVWDAVREAAGVPDVHVHDLRRTFGLAVARAAGLHVASKLLRHADVRVTAQIYAPLDFADLRAAAEQHGVHVERVSRMRPRKRLAS